jgi:hypothetical protein
MIYPAYIYPLPEECEIMQEKYPGWIFCDGFESGDFSSWNVISEDVTVETTGYMQYYQDGKYDETYYMFDGHVAHMNFLIITNEEENLSQKRFIKKNFDESLDHFFTRACLFTDNVKNSGIERELFRFLAVPDEDSSAENDWEVLLTSFDLNLALKIISPEDELSEEDNILIKYNLSKLNLFQWNCLEIEIKANTPGQKDGYVNIWNNDQLLYELKDINLRGDLESKINSFELGLSSTRQNFIHVAETRLWDNVIFSSEKIPLNMSQPNYYHGGCLEPEIDSGCGLVSESRNKRIGSVLILMSLLAICIAKVSFRRKFGN